MHTQLLDELLVLVELLEVLNAHGVHAQRLRLLAMLVVTKHAHLRRPGPRIRLVLRVSRTAATISRTANEKVYPKSETDSYAQNV